MSIKKILQAMEGERLDLCSKDELLRAIDLADIAMRMGPGHEETLSVCQKEGPLWDGDVPSKAHRDDLLEAGAIAKVVVNGEEGFNACTYKGLSLLRALSAKEESDA